MNFGDVDNLLLDEGGSPWESFTSSLEGLVTSRQYATWFSDMNLIRHDVNGICLGFPSKLHVDFVKKHHLIKIERAFLEAWNEVPAKIDLVFDGAMAKTLIFEPLPKPQSSPAKDQLANKESEKKTTQLLEGYRFENFVASGGFQMAYTIAQEVARNPGKSEFNPLIICGNTGMGKTHLANALGNYCFENETAPKVLFLTSEQFLIEFVTMVREQKKKTRGNYSQGGRVSSEHLMGMSKKWIECDLLIIDDIQFFVGKKETQDHFCQILNALTALNKQVVVTCDEDPQSFQEGAKSKKGTLDPRMLHKFRSGMTVEVDSLTSEVREAIFRKKIQNFRRAGYISEEVIRYLSDIPLENVRELEGTINKLFAYKELMQRDLTVELARVVLGDTQRSFKSPVTVEGIIQAVAQATDVTKEMIVSNSRIHKAALPRKVAMYLSRELTDNSLHTIGLHFSRNYATVIHSLKTLVKLMERDTEIASLVRSIKDKILNP